jgi:hypothetical protein
MAATTMRVIFGAGFFFVCSQDTHVPRQKRRAEVRVARLIAYLFAPSHAMEFRPSRHPRRHRQKMFSITGTQMDLRCMREVQPQQRSHAYMPRKEACQGISDDLRISSSMKCVRDKCFDQQPPPWQLQQWHSQQQPWQPVLRFRGTFVFL